jgi:hypothetical protein
MVPYVSPRRFPLVSSSFIAFRRPARNVFDTGLPCSDPPLTSSLGSADRVGMMKVIIILIIITVLIIIIIIISYNINHSDSNNFTVN